MFLKLLERNTAESVAGLTSPSAGFEELRKEVLSYANAGEGADSLAADARYPNALYVVITDERTYIPPEMLQRDEAVSHSLGLEKPYIRDTRPTLLN